MFQELKLKHILFKLRLSLLCLGFFVCWFVGLFGNFCALGLLLALPPKHQTTSKGFNEGLVSLHGFATQVNAISVGWIQAETFCVPFATTGSLQPYLVFVPISQKALTACESRSWKRWRKSPLQLLPALRGAAR